MRVFSLGLTENVSDGGAAFCQKRGAVYAVITDACKAGTASPSGLAQPASAFNSARTSLYSDAGRISSSLSIDRMAVGLAAAMGAAVVDAGLCSGPTGL